MADDAPGGFSFNQFLIAADEPLLFHTGPRGMFPLVAEAVARIVPVESVRWITFGHVESDECGSMNMWLTAAPHAQVAHGALGCEVSLDDMCDRPPRPLADGEVIDLGGKRVRHLDTPHGCPQLEGGRLRLVPCRQRRTRSLGIPGSRCTRCSPRPATVSTPTSSRCSPWPPT